MPRALTRSSGLESGNGEKGQFAFTLKHTSLAYFISIARNRKEKKPLLFGKLGSSDSFDVLVIFFPAINKSCPHVSIIIRPASFCPPSHIRFQPPKVQTCPDLPPKDTNLIHEIAMPQHERSASRSNHARKLEPSTSVARSERTLFRIQEFKILAQKAAANVHSCRNRYSAQPSFSTRHRRFELRGATDTKTPLNLSGIENKKGQILAESAQQKRLRIFLVS